MSFSVPPSPARRFFGDIQRSNWDDWEWQWRNRIRSAEALSRFLPLSEETRRAIDANLKSLRMGVTPYYLSLVDPDDPQDPIRQQAIPSLEELGSLGSGLLDPLAEEKLSPVPGLTHRYVDRCLMVVTNNCAVVCRHCTRRRIMAEGHAPVVNVDAMVDYIRATPTIRDVLISGGDPLTFSTARLERIVAAVRAVPHVEIIRIGSRVPVTLPQRVTPDLADMLARYHPIWLNTQFNHPRECTPEAALAVDRLLRAGIPVNNQTVLLRGINDDLPTMKRLVHALLRIRVRPYYVHVCDLVQGAEHLRTTIARAIELSDGLRGHTSGLAVPHFALELPGGLGKVALMPQYLLSYDARSGKAVFRNHLGTVVEYQDPVESRETP